MQCNYNSFIQIINFHGLFRSALRCRKTGACRILVPLRYLKNSFHNALHYAENTFLGMALQFAVRIFDISAIQIFFWCSNFGTWMLELCSKIILCFCSVLTRWRIVPSLLRLSQWEMRVIAKSKCLRRDKMGALQTKYETSKIFCPYLEML